MAAERRPGKKAAPDAAAELRRQAEELLAGLAEAAAVERAPEELFAAVHELRVHQIELEMQNEELRRAQLELDAQRARYVELYDLAPVGYLSLSEKGVVDEANFTAAHLLGVERQPLVGQPFSAFILAADQDVFYRHQRLLEKTGAPQSCELRLQPVGAEPFWAHLESQPQRAAAGESPRYHLAFTDVPERALAQEKLRASEERLDCAIEGSGVGLWDWHVQTGEAVFNERWAEIVGHTLAELAPLSIETWTSLCHPDDLERSGELLEQHFCGQSAQYECEARMRHKDGHWIWVLDRGKVSEWGSDGRPLRMIGTHLDISARKQAEEALRQSQEQLREAHRLAHMGVWSWTVDSDTVTWTDELYRIAGLDPNLPAPSYAEHPNIYAPESWGRLRTAVEEAMETGEPYQLELELIRPDGVIRWVNAVGGATHDDHGRVEGLYGTVHDITERKRAEDAVANLNDELGARAAALEEANAAITQIAATDHLTSLFSRRSFHESLERAVSLARRHGSSLALLSFDLDGLKLVNDSAGHAAGDEVLVSFAELLGSACRAEDLPGRLGGDEFCVLLPGIDLGGARGLAERVLAAVRSCAVLAQRGVTVSGGVAQWVPDDPPDDLLRRADEALYAAKRVGGDAVAVDG